MIDNFLLVESLVESPLIFIQWVGTRGDYYHHPIFMDVSRRPKKPTIPFNFNSTWLKEEDFLNFFKEVWIPISQEVRAPVQFEI